MSSGPLTREQIRELQRARILEAMVNVVAERGLRSATVAQVVARAGVSRVTFYELFKGLDECFLEVLDAAMRRMAALISQAVDNHGPLREKVLAGLAALLAFLDSDPPLARVCVVEALAGGTAALEHRVRVLEVLKHVVATVAEQAPSGIEVSPLWAEAVVASVSGILHTRIVTDEAPPFSSLLGPIAALVLAPHANLGRGFDQRVASMRSRANGHRPQSIWRRTDSSIPLALRTPRAYRARLCLLYVRDHPLTSNRAVAQAIGVVHGGQVSALLGRLERLGLLAKRAGAPGHPNAWWLTHEGERVAESVKIAL